jgi:hypothetical protein
MLLIIEIIYRKEKNKRVCTNEKGKGKSISETREKRSGRMKKKVEKKKKLGGDLKKMVSNESLCSIKSVCLTKKHTQKR